MVRQAEPAPTSAALKSGKTAAPAALARVVIAETAAALQDPGVMDHHGARAEDSVEAHAATALLGRDRVTEAIHVPGVMALPLREAPRAIVIFVAAPAALVTASVKAPAHLSVNGWSCPRTCRLSSSLKTSPQKLSQATSAAPAMPSACLMPHVSCLLKGTASMPATSARLSVLRASLPPMMVACS